MTVTPLASKSRLLFLSFRPNLATTIPDSELCGNHRGKGSLAYSAFSKTCNVKSLRRPPRNDERVPPTLAIAKSDAVTSGWHKPSLAETKSKSLATLFHSRVQRRPLAASHVPSQRCHPRLQNLTIIAPASSPASAARPSWIVASSQPFCERGSAIRKHHGDRELRPQDDEGRAHRRDWRRRGAAVPD